MQRQKFDKFSTINQACKQSLFGFSGESHLVTCSFFCSKKVPGTLRHVLSTVISPLALSKQEKICPLTSFKKACAFGVKNKANQRVYYELKHLVNLSIITVHET